MVVIFDYFTQAYVVNQLRTILNLFFDSAIGY